MIIGKRYETSNKKVLFSLNKSYNLKILPFSFQQLYIHIQLTVIWNYRKIYLAYIQTVAHIFLAVQPGYVRLPGFFFLWHYLEFNCLNWQNLPEQEEKIGPFL